MEEKPIYSGEFDLVSSCEGYLFEDFINIEAYSKENPKEPLRISERLHFETLFGKSHLRLAYPGLINHSEVLEKYV